MLIALLAIKSYCNLTDISIVLGILSTDQLKKERIQDYTQKNKQARSSTIQSKRQSSFIATPKVIIEEVGEAIDQVIGGPFSMIVSNL